MKSPVIDREYPNKVLNIPIIANKDFQLIFDKFRAHWSEAGDFYEVSPF
jgi:hypothetical protein